VYKFHVGTALRAFAHPTLAANSWYDFNMTKLLEQAIETARRLPTDEQDAIARAILQLAGRDNLPPVPLTPEEREAIAKSKVAAARGEFASDDEVRAVWAKHGR